MLEFAQSKVKMQECLSNNIRSFKLRHIIYQTQNPIYIFSKYILENNNSHVTYISGIWLHVSGTYCTHYLAFHEIWIFGEK
jgi:hypothetical protein